MFGVMHFLQEERIYVSLFSKVAAIFAACFLGAAGYFANFLESLEPYSGIVTVFCLLLPLGIAYSSLLGAMMGPLDVAHGTLYAALFGTRELPQILGVVSMLTMVAVGASPDSTLLDIDQNAAGKFIEWSAVSGDVFAPFGPIFLITALQMNALNDIFTFDIKSHDQPGLGNFLLHGDTTLTERAPSTATTLPEVVIRNSISNFTVIKKSAAASAIHSRPVPRDEVIEILR